MNYLPIFLNETHHIQAYNAKYATYQNAHRLYFIHKDRQNHHPPEEERNTHPKSQKHHPYGNSPLFKKNDCMNHLRTKMNTPIKGSLGFSYL